MCAYPLSAPSGFVSCSASAVGRHPPAARIEVGKTMRPVVSQVPPHGVAAGAMIVAAPPATGARRSLPPAKNAMHAAVG